MAGAGALDTRLQFQMRNAKEDGYGTVDSDWQPQFERWAGVTYRRGGEDVLAARLEARQPAIIRIRNSMMARSITSDWRAVVMVNGEARGPVFNIRENPTRSTDRAYLEMLAERGVAT